MCSGAVLLYGIPQVVVGENRTFRGPETYVRGRGVEIEIVDDPTCVQMMKDFIAARPELWREDIGVSRPFRSQSVSLTGPTPGGLPTTQRTA